MKPLFRLLVFSCLLIPGVSRAATITETWSFEALFLSQLVSPYYGAAATPSSTRGYLIEREGLSVGTSYSGHVSIEYDGLTGQANSVSCAIGSFMCALSGTEASNYLLGTASTLRGPSTILQLGRFNSQSSLFRFAGSTGTYLYADDFGSMASVSGFSLGAVSYDLSEVPVPTSLPLLAAGLGGLIWLRRRQTRA